MSDKLSQAITTIKAGDKQAGRKILIEILKTEPHNENAWLWMTQVVSKKQEKIKCLEQVLKINPDNQIAQEGMARLRPVKSPGSDNITSETNASAAHLKGLEKTRSTARRVEKAKKRNITSKPNDQQLIQRFIAKRTSQGWQVVNQTDTSVQMRKPKRWSPALLVLGGIFLIFFGFGLIFWILAVVDYAIKKEQTIFITSDKLRKSIGKEKAASNTKGLLILAGVLIGVFIFCVVLTLSSPLLTIPSGNNISSSEGKNISTAESVQTSNMRFTITQNSLGSKNALREEITGKGWIFKEVETMSDGTRCDTFESSHVVFGLCAVGDELKAIVIRGDEFADFNPVFAIASIYDIHYFGDFKDAVTDTWFDLSPGESTVFNLDTDGVIMTIQKTYDDGYGITYVLESHLP